MLKNAMEAAKQPAEKKLVLEVLQPVPSETSLKMALDSLKAAELKDDATAAACSSLRLSQEREST